MVPLPFGHICGPTPGVIGRSGGMPATVPAPDSADAGDPEAANAGVSPVASRARPRTAPSVVASAAAVIRLMCAASVRQAYYWNPGNAHRLRNARGFRSLQPTNMTNVLLIVSN